MSVNPVDIGAMLSLNQPDLIAKSFSPDRQEPTAPEHVTDNVARSYVRAKAALGRNEADTAAMQLGKALDTVLTEKYPHTGTGMLGQKLSKLRPNIDVPESLHQWAVHLKALRNDATHQPEDAPIEEIAELAGFTEMLLLYTYTMPKLLELRKAGDA